MVPAWTAKTEAFHNAAFSIVSVVNDRGKTQRQITFKKCKLRSNPRYNFQVVEVLATVIKKEKEDENENKGELTLRQLCPRQTLSRPVQTVRLTKVYALAGSIGSIGAS